MGGCCVPALKLLWQESKHHFVRGNVRTLPKCGVCSKLVGAGPTFSSLGDDFRCSLCSMRVHEECLGLTSKACKGGSLRKAVVLPHEVDPGTGCVLAMPDKRPLLCFINSRSGATQGADVFYGLSRYLNKIQVRDLHEDKGPAKGLELFRACFQTLRILACGGDGTFGWVQSAIDALGDVPHRPAVGHFPLGTGNDMSRSLGFGAGYAGENIKVTCSCGGCCYVVRGGCTRGWCGMRSPR
jgi:diacylglycerol kinase (ATP)